MTEKDFVEWLNSINFNQKEEQMNEPRPKLNSIAWHEECLENSRQYESKLTEEMNFLVERFKKAIEKINSDNDFLAKQIQLAKKKGKTHFDAERFGRSARKKKEAGNG